MRTHFLPLRSLTVLAVGAVALQATFAAAQVAPIRRGAPPRTAQPPMRVPAAAAEEQRKREPMSPVERLTRDLGSGERSSAFIGVLMHSLDRVLAGEPNKTELDLAVERGIARNGVSRARLAQMVADYKAVPVEARARSMPRELATLERGTGLTFAQAQRLAAAPAGASGIVVQGGLRPPGARIGTMQAPAPPKDEASAAPRIDAVGARVEGAERRIVLDGSFSGTSPIVPIYLKPAEGQSLAEVGSQMVDGETVAVVLGRVNSSRSRIEGGLPVGLAPGKYTVSVRVPRGPGNEPKSNARTVDLAGYAYTVRLLSIKCLDESNPESVPNPLTLSNIPVSDEVRVSWAAFADAGTAEVGTTREYEKFDDGTERQIQMAPTDDGGIFMRSGGEASAGVVANRLFVVAQLWEVDGSDFSMMQDGRFIADIGRASMDELDVQQFLERLSQALYWSMAQFRGSHESLGEVRLSFSAPELQQMTNNEGGRHRGEMRFANGDSKGSYLVHYEIRRH
jgi:hypothetical protein